MACRLPAYRGLLNAAVAVAAPCLSGPAQRRRRRLLVRIDSSLELGAWGHAPEQDRGEDGHSYRDGGADRGGHLQPLGKRVSSRIEQPRADLALEPLGHPQGAAEGTPRGFHTLVPHPRHS
jgi:hypothetical protein